jgi:quinol monooxygenase YgiN
MMSELTNVACITAKPGKSTQLGAELRRLMGLTRSEPGCERYEIHRSMRDSQAWLILESWCSTTDFDEHMQAQYVTAFLAKVPDLCTGEIDIRGYKECSPTATEREVGRR